MGRQERSRGERRGRRALRWVRRSTGPGGAELGALLVDRDGDLYAVGTYEGTEDLGDGPLPVPQEGAGPGVFLAAYSREGKPRWSRGLVPLPLRVLGATEVKAAAVSERGNLTVVVRSRYPLSLGDERTPAGSFLARFSCKGRLLWTRPLMGFYGGRTDHGLSLAVDEEENILLAGSFSGKADFGGGELVAETDTAFLAKYSEKGEYRWHHVFASGLSTHFEAVTTDSKDDIYAAGFFSGTVSYGGERFSSDREVAVLAKYSPSGEHRWSKAEVGVEVFNGVAVHGNRVMVTGSYRGHFQFGKETFREPEERAQAGLLLAYTRDGEERWGQRLGRYTFGIAVDHEDKVTVAGFASAGDDLGKGPLPEGETPFHFFLARYDRVLGKPCWVRTYPFGTRELAVNRDGEVVLGTSFSGTLYLGAERLTAEGPTDVALVRLCS